MGRGPPFFDHGWRVNRRDRLRRRQPTALPEKRDDSSLFQGRCGAGVPGALGQPAQADKIKNPTAVFSGLDKITGRIIAFEVAVDETVQFGALQMTPRGVLHAPADREPADHHLRRGR
jgi:hypothetical protein